MYEEILDLIKVSQDFVLTSHVNPDGDSIGSEIAFYNFLKKSGKNARIINYSETPYNYVFLDKNHVVEIFDESRHLRAISDADVIVILDTNEYSRIRTMEAPVKESRAKKVCIDHHAGINGNGFDLYISDTSSPATGEILFDFFERAGFSDIDSDTAIALYTAIMTDTGSFRFPRTTAKTHYITAKLITLGADPFEIYSEVYNRSSIGRLKLLSAFLNNIGIRYDGRFAFSYLLTKDFENACADELDTDGFSANLMNIEGVVLSVVMLETRGGMKLSFRSKGSIKANEFAKAYGGGGHINAAGAFVPGADFEASKENVIELAKSFLL